MPSNTKKESSSSLLRSGAIVSTITMLSRVLGLVRDILLARFIGAGGDADAFYIAFKVPNFLRRLFAEGAFAQAFIPVLSEFREQGSHAAVQNVVDRVAGCLGITLLALCSSVIVAAPAVAAIFGAGFLFDAQYEKIVDLEQELLKEQENSNELTELVNQRLSLEILFETGLDDPSIADLEKLRELSLFLLSNPSFKLKLSGHADHRGTDEYNNVLALERAKSVAAALNDYGISDSLISIKGYGSDHAKSKADAAELALDRRVDINIVFDDAEPSSTEAQIVDISF